MANRNGGDKRDGARAGRTSGRRTSAFAPQDVVQFAPNFTVYVLPPDAVCLYSEDRKFFLHGELYCALASAIGKGEKAFRDLVREIKRDFPSDKVHEAMSRLLDRGYLVAASGRSADVAAACWASIGLPIEAAEANLRNCSVRIEAIDAPGATELGAALRKLGVRVVEGASSLTVRLVNDYLEGQLAALNSRHVADRTSWLLVQPCGIFPLVGPVFRPGKSACWTCLTDRMVRNREIKGFLDRGSARRVAVSPLARKLVGRGAIELAAVEIAKAIATDFRTDLSDHILSLDLMGATIVKHHVAARPQCPVCGSKRLRDSNRAPLPVKLGTGAKLVMTSGGYRTVSSRTTVDRFRKHVSALTGVVSRLERVDADVPMNTNYYAGHNFSAPARSIDELRAALSGGSFGKGSTAEQGEASALMEAIERYSGIFQGDETRTARRFTDFAPGDAIHPNDVLRYSDAQFNAQAASPDAEPLQMSAPFDPSAEIEWSPVWSLLHQRFRFLPTGLLYFFHRGPGQINADSNGCAAGNTLEEAIVQGFLELVERDTYAIWWYNGLRRPELELDQFHDAYVRDLRNQLADDGRKLWVLDLTNDIGIPSFVAIAHWMQNSRENIEFGSGAHFDSRIALLRALTELTQFLSVGVMADGSGEKSTLDGVTALRLRNYPFLTPRGRVTMRPGADAKLGRLDDTRAQVEACLRVVRRMKLDFLVLDQTRPDIKVPVARVIVPGLRHFYRRFASGRLYDVPVKLGWLEQPRPESDLTPFLPHT